MRILVTNDDGIYSPGIDALASALSAVGDVTVIAPIAEMSAVGHSITISDPLRVIEVARHKKFFGYGVNGTPADCVKLAFTHLLPEPPDLVVSGINRGANLATNVIYSGTVSAATEGAMFGVKSFAVSLTSHTPADYAPAAKFAAFFANYINELDVPSDVLFNVNVPNVPEHEITGWRFAKQGMSKYLDTFERRVDPRGHVYYWLTGEKVEVENGDDSDDVIINDNVITVTPLKYDLTDHALYARLKTCGGTRWNA